VTILVTIAAVPAVALLLALAARVEAILRTEPPAPAGAPETAG
jgi:hypothetical protein